jgi:hypothetical protein
MSTVPMPPGRAFYIRIFSISMIVLVAALLGFLFGVRMEASVPVAGVLQARDQQSVRAPASGVAELGWFEGKMPGTKGQSAGFRLDVQGNGLARSDDGTTQPIHHYLLPDGTSVKAIPRQFHVLTTGDHLWPGQVVAWMLLGETNKPASVTLPGKNLSQGQMPGDSHPVFVPKQHSLWQVLKVHAESLAPVGAGQPLATIAPIDPGSHEPVEVLAHLEIGEDVCAEVEVGQVIRLSSNVFSSRLYGLADAKLLVIEPLAELHGDGKRYFHATAVVTQSPFPLRLGSSVSGKIIVGRKTVYRIILEH